MWICTSKSTDFLHKAKQTVSYVLGAVYVVHAIGTQEFNKQYPKQRLKQEYNHCMDCDYQAIIPSRDYARIELPTPLMLHYQFVERMPLVRTLHAVRRHTDTSSSCCLINLSKCNSSLIFTLF